MSTSKGQWFDEKTTAQLFEAILDDILNQPLRLSETFKGCVDATVASSSSICRIIPCGPTNASSSLVAALKNNTNAQVILHDVDSQTPSGIQRLNQSPRTSRRPKLAIVGMGGRFPNAEDHEKFWDLLYAGMDLHRRVRFVFTMSNDATTDDLQCRYPQIDLTLISTTTLLAKSVIPVTRLSVVLSTIPVISTRAFSTCHRERRLRPTRCTALD